MDSKVNIVTITPSMAASYLDLKPPIQRRLNHTHVKNLMHEMKHGRFQSLHDPIILAKVDHAIYLLNGQHRLAALVKYGKSLPFLVMEIEFDSIDEMNMYYAGIDQGMMRGSSVIGQTVKEVYGLDLTHTELTKIGAAVKFILRNFDSHGPKAPISLQERMIVLLASVYLPVRQNFAGISDTMNKPFMRATVLSVVLTTLAFSRHAIKFWRNVVQMNAETTAERKLATHLLSVSTGNVYGKKKVTYAEDARYVAAYWNMYRAGNIMINRRDKAIIKNGGKIYITDTPFVGEHYSQDDIVRLFENAPNVHVETAY